MDKIFIIILGFILIIYVFNLTVKRIKKVTYKKAGKKWEGIVNELSKRK